MKRKGPSGKSSLPQEASYTLSNVDQVKVLADPLRIRILEALCEERTTKQVAELLGEKQTKLYHHVDALERVGLIKLSRTRPNRGTLEKYYLAVARTFRADSRIFQTTEDKGGGEEAAALRQMMSTIFDTTAAELDRLIAEENATKSLEEDAIVKDGIVSFLEVRGSKRELDEIRDKINALVKSITAIAGGGAEGGGTGDAERYRLTLAYYPLKE